LINFRPSRALSVCHGAVKSEKPVNLIRIELERILELSRQQVEPDLQFGKLGIDLTGRSAANVREEAKRWDAICKCPELASADDRKLIRSVGSAANVAAEWAAATNEYDAFVGKAKLQAVKINTIRQGVRSEMDLATQTVCLAEAGRWNDAIIAAGRLEYWAWRQLIGMIKYEQKQRV
jgi:hypothetical protein